MKNEKYSDIINLPHPDPRTRPRMSLSDRAAQFAPFAALTGFDDAIGETGRVVEQPIILAQDALEELDSAIRKIQDTIETQPEAEVVWFRPDSRKAGGCIHSARGRVKQVDIPGQLLLFADGKSVPLKEITSIRLEEEYPGP